MLLTSGNTIIEKEDEMHPNLSYNYLMYPVMGLAKHIVLYKNNVVQPAFIYAGVMF